MKKLLVTLLCIFALFVPSVMADETKTNEKVKVYLFSKENCPYCNSANEFFVSIYDEYGEYFELVSYEVYDANWNANATYKAIMDEVAEKMGDEVDGVPYIVIGDDYSVNGFQESMGDELKQAIMDAYEDDEYVDIVEEISSTQEAEHSSDGIIIVAILIVAIGSIVAFVLVSRKKAKNN